MTTVPVRPRSIRTWALLAGAAAALLSLAWSWRPSIWFDETASLSAVRRPWWSLIDVVHHVDLVHLTFYSLLRCWSDVFGTSGFAIRSLSAVLLGACCALGVLVTKELFDERVAAWSALTFLLLPGLTWSGFDARSSAFSCFASMLAVWVLLKAKARGGRWWALYAAALMLSVFVQLLTVIALVVHLVIARERWRPWALSAAVALVLLSPFILAAHEQQGQISWLHIQPLDSAVSVGFSQFFLGLRSDSHNPLVTIVGPALLGLSAWALVAIGWRRSRGWAIALVWALAPATLAVAWSMVAAPVYQERYFSWCAPAYAMLMAAGIDRLWRSRRPLGVALTAMAVLGALPVTVAQRGPHAKYDQDYRLLASYVRVLPRAGTGVFYATPASRAGSIAYPSSFSGLHDFSIGQSPVASGTLFGVNAPDRTTIARLRAAHVTHVLLLFEFQTPLRKRPQLHELQAAGCTLQWDKVISRTSAAWFECTWR